MFDYLKKLSLFNSKAFYYLVLLLVLTVSLTACTTNNATYVNNEKVKVFADKRVELFCVLQALAAYNLRVQSGQTRNVKGVYENYLSDIEVSFYNHKNHPAVQKIQMLFGQYLLIDGNVGSYATAFNDEFKLHQGLSTEAANNLVLRLGGEEQLAAFSQDIIDFSEIIDFESFFEKHSSYYDEQTKNVERKFIDKGNVEHAINYFGKELNSYNIIISPMSRVMSSRKLENDNGELDAYIVMGIPRVDHNWQIVLFHEIAHAYTGQLSTTLAEKGEELLKLVPTLETINDYPYYPVQTEEARVIRAIDEYIAHASSFRIMALNISKSQSKNYMNKVKKLGFVHLEELGDKLMEYESNRDEYPTFDDFVPEIIRFFEQLAES